MEAAEEQASMKSERPKYSPIIFLAVEGITGVCENYIIPVDVICTTRFSRGEAECI